jgi:hypothetical protein
LVVFAALAGPVRALEYFDYGFTQVDNSSGGSVLDGYVSQQLWADTELLLLGAQLRIELESGSLFQDTFLGSEFSFGGPPEVLAAEQPSLAFDTYVGINGAQPGIVLGGAVNLGGDPGIQFNDAGINAAWSSGPGNLRSGRFDLGMITLSGDAVGRGAILLSGAGEEGFDRREMFAHEFVIESGVVRFLGEPEVHAASYLPHREPELPPDPEAPSDPLPDVEPPPLFDPDPIIEPDPAPPVGGAVDLGGAAGGPPLEIFIYDPNLEPELGIFYYETVEWPLDAEFILDRLELADDMDAITIGPGDLAVLQALDGTQASLLTATVGELAVPLSSLNDETVAGLLSTGNWTVRGANLVFGAGAGGGIPEPSGIVLALLGVAGAICWRRSFGRSWQLRLRYAVTANPRR